MKLLKTGLEMLSLAALGTGLLLVNFDISFESIVEVSGAAAIAFLHLFVHLREQPAGFLNSLLVEFWELLG